MKIVNEKLWSKEIYNGLIDFTNQPSYWVPIFDPKKDPAVIIAKKVLDSITDKTSEDYKNAEILYNAALKAADSSKLLTQKQVDELIAKETGKLKEGHRNTLEELNLLKEQANLTVKERADLEQKIEAAQATLITTEELAAQNAEKLEKRHTKEIEDLTNRKSHWKKLYTTSTINGAIRDACEIEGQQAFSSKQVLAILSPDTKLVEALDKQGKPNGILTPEVSFKDKDKDGKPIVLKLHPTEAVKRMSEMTEHANLFKGKGKGGGGLNNEQHSSADLKALGQDPAAYRAARKDGSLTLE
jgi:hypothetical protein